MLIVAGFFVSTVALDTGSARCNSGDMSTTCLRRTPFLYLIASALLLRSASLLGQNLLQNGSFEQLILPAHDLVGWGWTYSRTLVVNEPARCADGKNCAIVTGSLFQDVSTQPDHIYSIQFAFGGNDGGQQNRGPLHVLWGDVEIATIPITLEGRRYQYLMYEAPAVSDITRLTFSTVGAQSWPYIDDVSVRLVAVPEPRVWAIMVASASSCSIFAADVQEKDWHATWFDELLPSSMNLVRSAECLRRF